MAEKQKRRYFNLARLTGWDFVASFNKSLGRTVSGMFKPKQSERQETFEEASARLKLTEADIQQRTRHFLRLTLAFGGLALLVLVYAIYLFCRGDLAAGVLCSAVILIILTQVFRYHFWYFQMKKRKLGCTFKEWLRF